MCGLYRRIMGGGISGHLEHDHRKVVILGRTRGELVRARNHCGDELHRGILGVRTGRLYQPFFSPFLQIPGHGFADPVG